MLKFLTKSKIFIKVLILFNILTISVYPQNNIPKLEIQSSFDLEMDVLSQLYTEDHLPSFDAIIRLIEEMEDGTLAKLLSTKEYNKISFFIASFAKEGINPNASEEEIKDLENDIYELLNIDKNIIHSNVSFDAENYSIFPAVSYKNADTYLCKSWVSKQFNHTGKFIKKHKTAVIITAVVIVAAIAVVATVAATTVAAVGAAGALNSGCKTSNNIENKAQENNNACDQTFKDMLFSEQFENCKNELFKNDLLKFYVKDEYFSIESSKILGSNLAYNALNDPNIKNYFENNFVDFKYVDKMFAPYENFYNFDPNKTLPENVYSQIGQLALKEEYFDIAIDNFDKLIEINPKNSDAYLQKAFTHYENGDLEKSIEDFNIYATIIEDKPITNYLSNSVDFVSGFRSGLFEGGIDSGKQLALFAANTITHPVDTTVGIYQAFSSLANLAVSQEWKTLSQVIAPEICDIIKNWNDLSPNEKGRQSGYILGKYGADILLPGAVAKGISKGVKSAEELINIVKNLERAEQVLALEAVAANGTKVGSFKPNVLNLNSSEIISNSANIIKNLNFDKLAEAGKVIDRSGLTKAGRALAKHGGREGSTFPKPKGTPAQINQQGQAILEKILNDPNKIVKIENSKRFGKIIDIEIPNKGGVRYNTNGEFITFIEPY